MIGPLKVALLIETSRGYGRGLLRGIMKYASLYGPWQFHLTPGDFEQAVPKMKDWKGDGIIARVINRKTADFLAKSGLPLIALDLPETIAQDFRRKGVRFVELASDSAGATQMAVDHLAGKRFQHFAFVGYYGQVWSEKREKMFVDLMAQRGHSVHLYRRPIRQGVPLSWEKEEHILAQWLKELPKPIGLMTCNDQRGREVLDVCSLEGITVPEEISVIGVDNDELLCGLSFPPLSSVLFNTIQGGYLAAMAFHKMIKGEAVEEKTIIVSPLHVVERRSTEAVAIDDADVAAALRFIHTQSPDQLLIDNVVESTLVSRRVLELRFRKLLGRTILQEIQKVRIERAKRLLLETGYSVPQVAECVGFETASYFIQFFRDKTGTTPARYRKQTRND